MRTADAPTTSRSGKRTRVLMTATVFTPEGAHKVLIRNVSPTGAQVVSEMAMRPDCDAILKRGQLFVAARVSWTAEKEAGLGFYRELSPAEVDSALHQVLLRA